MRQARAQTGFAPPPQRPLGRERRGVALAALFAATALMLGIVVAAAVVSVSMAHA
jgi:hypothetical protein